MDIMNYSTFRSQLAHTLDKVNDDHTPVLMASLKNAERLNQAIAAAIMS